MRVRIVGITDRNQDPADSFLLRALSHAIDDEIVLTEERGADLTLVYPYRLPLRSAVGGALVSAALARAAVFEDAERAERAVRRVYGIPDRVRILVVSHENFDRSPWSSLGRLVRSTRIPRLTSWPQSIDQPGFRLPYWWNYVDWPELPPVRSASLRFGKSYDLNELCTPQALPTNFFERRPAAVWVTSHLDFPRRGILRALRQVVPVDVLSDVPFGEKLSVLRSYQYCVTTENSPGYGYETEKLPEARTAGCIPIGYVQNPFSDFNPDAFFFMPPKPTPERLSPLLRYRPVLTPLFEYLRTAVDLTA